MLSLRSLFVPLALTTWASTTTPLVAQEPESDPPAATESSPAEGAREERREGRRGGRRRALTVIEAGTVHPVSGPAIENGVVVIRGDRILAIGKQGDLRLPPNTTVHSFPNGHVYPGLIDASTDAFCTADLRADGSLDASVEVSEGLVWLGERDDQLAAAGITVAYVSAPSGAAMPGQGAIVLPLKDGFELWKDREQAGLQYRIASGAGASHALLRQQKLDGIGKPFEGLDKYREAAEKFEKDLEKYQEEFEKYLEHHRKKNGKDKADGKAGAGDKPAGERPAKKAGDEQPDGGAKQEAPEKKDAPTPEKPPEKDGAVSDEQFEQALTTLLAALADEASADEASAEGSGADAAPQDPKPAPQGRPGPQGPQGKPADADAKGKAAPADDKAKKDDGPKRPEYPKKPRVEPAKEVMLEVLDGELPLRVVAHRPDELRAALRMQRDLEIPLLVLEQAYGADEVADELAEQGATVVLENVLPNSLRAGRKSPYDAFDPAALPKRLNDAGVPFAIATGGARLAPMLPLMAATAVGRGLSADAALRAITLTPAEILGIAADTGSLDRGKFADVLVTDGPLFASDSRVLLVLSRGRTQFEATASENK